jgi:hypothetical protein
MHKNKIPLDIYDFILMPRAKQNYIMLHGNHFSKDLYEYAASLMFKLNKQTNKEEKVPALTKDEVDAMLKKHNITLTDKGEYDYVYVAQSIKADYLGGSIADEAKMALHIKEVCEDVDAPDGLIFKQWCLRQDLLGNPVDWEDFLE